MSKLIALDDGHGMQTIGKRTPFIPEIGRFVHENEFNRAVVNYLDAELKRCGFRTLLVAPSDGDTPLKARTDLANKMKADAYVSVHYDALDGKFDGEGKDPQGHTIYVWTGQRNKASGKLAECVLKYLNQGTPQQNRGIKEANFQVLRDSKMIAILSENGFMDNKKEALLMVDPNFQKEVAIEHAKGICEYFGVAYKSETVTQQKTQSQPLDSADGYLKKGEKGKNVQQLNLWLNELDYTTKTDDFYDQYTDAAFRLFLKSQGLSEDTVYTSAIGDLLVKAIDNKKNLLNVDTIPTKNPEMYRLAKFVDTTNQELIKQLKAEGYRLIEVPSK